MFPDVEIKAIQDDATLMGSPDVVFDTLDDEGCAVSKGALSVLIEQLEARGLAMAEDKFECVGTTADACIGKPDWLKEPTVFTSENGDFVVNARGIYICNNPIGEAEFVQAFLGEKFKGICSAIEKSSSALRPSSSHAEYLAFYYSYQTRFDYWFATNNTRYTYPLALKIDSFLRSTLCNLSGVNLFDAPPEGAPCVNLTSERVVLKCRNGGLGFRPYESRYLLLNSLNNTMPQAIDRVDESGSTRKGLWNSLKSILGQGSFDPLNKATCWEYFHHSGSSFGVDHLELIELVQARYANCLAALGLGFPDKENVLMASTSCFGFGFKKLHKSIQDMLRELDYKGVLLSMQELAGDDQRRLSFMSSHHNTFANAFPLALAPDAF